MRVDVGSATLECLVDGQGPLVLLAHGFPDGPSSFRHQVAPLTARGYRVVRPYLRGYAPSSLARDARYDVGRLAEDLLQVAAHFSNDPFVLVGHDWGAIAAYAAAARAPERIRKLVTAAVPHLRVAGPRWLHPRQLRKSWYIGFFQLRGVAEWRVRAHDLRFVDELWRAWSPGLTAAPDEIKDGFRDPRHLSAVLGYYRAIGSPSAKILREKTRVPSLYLHGADDGCVGVEMCEGVERAYTAGVRVRRIGGAGHFLQLEKPDDFTRELLDFLA